jgi:hypothetical protein
VVHRFRGGSIGKLRPYKKWAFTLNQKRGTLDNFANSLRSQWCFSICKANCKKTLCNKFQNLRFCEFDCKQCEVVPKVARFCFVNAAISPVAFFLPTLVGNGKTDSVGSEATVGAGEARVAQFVYTATSCGNSVASNFMVCSIQITEIQALLLMFQQRPLVQNR